MSQDTEIFIGRPHRRGNSSEFEREGDDPDTSRLQHHDVEALSRESTRYSTVRDRNSNGASNEGNFIAKDDSKISKSIAVSGATNSIYLE